MREIQHLKVIIKGNETMVERNYSYIDFKGELKQPTVTTKSKNTEGDSYDKRIGIVVAILKSLRFSRRVVRKISDILLEENEKKRM